MKVYCQIQKRLAIIGLGSHRQPFNSRNLLVLLFLGVGDVLSCVHLFCEAKTFQDYAESIYTCITFIAASINFAYIVCEMRQLFDFLNEAEKIINDRIENHPLSREIYEQANRRTESGTKIIMFLVFNIFYPTLMILLLIANFYVYFTLDLGVDTFRLLLSYWFPFDWKNPRGFLIALTLSYVVEMNMLFSLVCDLCTGIGFYIFSMALANDMEDDFKAFNNRIKLEPNPLLLSKQFFDLFQFHSTAKRFVCNLTDIVQPIFMIIIGVNIVTICLAMLSIQVGMSQKNLMLFFIAIYELIATFTFLFIPCELAERMSSRGDDITDLIGQFDWYLFPREMKKLLPLIVLNAQKKVGFKCFGSFLCNRNTFWKVMKCTFSYFMTLRAFE